MPTKRLPKLPAAAEAERPPCERCEALCCRYFALQLDTPEDADDFDSIRWYLLHRHAWIWVEDGDWYLQVDEPCRHLDAANHCTVYDRRPKICREDGLAENREHPGDPLCDVVARDARHDHEFRTMEELDAYVDAFLAEKEARRRRRSEAAKKARAARLAKQPAR